SHDSRGARHGLLPVHRACAAWPQRLHRSRSACEMKKPLLPFPLLWVLLTAMWLLLYLSLHPAHWLLGAVVAFAAMSLYALLQPPIRLLHRLRAITDLLV